ncbi:hypothetical protein HDV05_004635 [Chytridiales sp. JEL 0842]|nr:hypothetical protein HDV05_004635 [Chytridiales sp. JEL 0842]
MICAELTDEASMKERESKILSVLESAVRDLRRQSHQPSLSTGKVDTEEEEQDHQHLQLPELTKDSLENDEEVDFSQYIHSSLGSFNANLEVVVTNEDQEGGGGGQDPIEVFEAKKPTTARHRRSSKKRLGSILKQPQSSSPLLNVPASTCEPSLEPFSTHTVPSIPFHPTVSSPPPLNPPSKRRLSRKQKMQAKIEGMFGALGKLYGNAQDSTASATTATTTTTTTTDAADGNAENLVFETRRKKTRKSKGGGSKRAPSVGSSNEKSYQQVVGLQSSVVVEVKDPLEAAVDLPPASIDPSESSFYLVPYPNQPITSSIRRAVPKSRTKILNDHILLVPCDLNPNSAIEVPVPIHLTALVKSIDGKNGDVVQDGMVLVPIPGLEGVVGGEEKMMAVPMNLMEKAFMDQQGLSSGNGVIMVQQGLSSGNGVMVDQQQLSLTDSVSIKPEDDSTFLNLNDPPLLENSQLERSMKISSTRSSPNRRKRPISDKKYPVCGRFSKPDQVSTALCNAIQNLQERKMAEQQSLEKREASRLDNLLSYQEELKKVIMNKWQPAPNEVIPSVNEDLVSEEDKKSWVKDPYLEKMGNLLVHSGNKSASKRVLALNVAAASGGGGGDLSPTDISNSIWLSPERKPASNLPPSKLPPPASPTRVISSPLPLPPTASVPEDPNAEILSYTPPPSTALSLLAPTAASWYPTELLPTSNPPSDTEATTYSNPMWNPSDVATQFLKLEADAQKQIVQKQLSGLRSLRYKDVKNVIQRVEYAENREILIKPTVRKPRVKKEKPEGEVKKRARTLSEPVGSTESKRRRKDEMGVNVTPKKRSPAKNNNAATEETSGSPLGLDLLAYIADYIHSPPSKESPDDQITPPSTSESPSKMVPNTPTQKSIIIDSPSKRKEDQARDLIRKHLHFAPESSSSSDSEVDEEAFGTRMLAPQNEAPAVLTRKSPERKKASPEKKSPGKGRVVGRSVSESPRKRSRR